MSMYSNYTREELEDRKSELELDIERVQEQLHGYNSVFPTDVNDLSAAGDGEPAQEDQEGTTKTAQDLEELTDALKQDLNEVLESLKSFERGL